MVLINFSIDINYKCPSQIRLLQYDRSKVNTNCMFGCDRELLTYQCRELLSTHTEIWWFSQDCWEYMNSYVCINQQYSATRTRRKEEKLQGVRGDQMHQCADRSYSMKSLTDELGVSPAAGNMSHIENNPCVGAMGTGKSGEGLALTWLNLL